MLKSSITTLDEVPAAHQEHYKQVDANDPTRGYVLNFDGAEKLSQFRDNNNKHKADLSVSAKSIEELKAQLNAFEGLSPDIAKTAMAALDREKDSDIRKLMEAGKYDEVIDIKLKATIEGYVQQIEAKDKLNQDQGALLETANSQLGRIHLSDMVNKAMVEAKVNPHASTNEYMRFQAEQYFGIQDGELVSKTSELNAKGEPIGIPDFIQRMVTTNPFAFKQAGGGGADPNTQQRATVDGKHAIGTDPMEFGRHLESISKGDTIVVQGR